jgi:hypothetical protein
MAYLVSELIANAYYTAGLVARDFQAGLTGGQAEDGLFFLNSVIGQMTVQDGCIPYYTVYNFDSQVGVASYLIPGLIKADTVVFYMMDNPDNPLRYQMEELSRYQNFGTSRADNIQSLPFNYYIERCFGGARLYLYFTPQQPYPMEIHGLFRLQEVTLYQDLSLTLDRFYIDFLQYKLTERLCAQYSYDVPPGVAAILMQYQKQIDKQTQKMDITIQKISTFNSNNLGLNYGQINLGKGWYPI